jgi:hypothetical protein
LNAIGTGLSFEAYDANRDANLVERRKLAAFYTLVSFERRVPAAA